MSAGPKSTNMRVRAYVADFLSMLDQLQRHAEILDELCLQAVAVDLYLHDSGNRRDRASALCRRAHTVAVVYEGARIVLALRGRHERSAPQRAVGSTEGCMVPKGTGRTPGT